ncbi:hypothetical protein HOY80DRAFT_1138976 [Tuber brumale]|nr:hypothetical protein HOY80DRAFT_1138976 [Tuber brumale]
MSYSDEFPLLEGVGLYASDISGDGNYMRNNASYFKLFLDVGPTRRAPKRKAAKNNTGKNAAVTAAPPSESAIDVAFAQHLSRMARSGVYGDNMEISAFAREYGCDVKIYQRDFAYVVTGGDGGGHEGGGGRRDPGKGKKRVLHIAYHTWEHYSSVRNRDGPHTGPPNVSLVPLTEEGRKEQEKKLANSSYVQPWMVETVTSSLPYLVGSQKILEALEEARGNIDVAVSRLLDVEEGEQEGADEPQKQEEEESEKKGYADKNKDVKVEKVDITLGDGEKVKGKEAEKADAQGSPEIQDNADEANDLAADTDSAGTPKRPTPKIGTRASARIRAREDSGGNPGSEGGLEDSGSAAEGGRKQRPLHPKKETPRERKARKAAAKQREKENAPGNKDAELEKDSGSAAEEIRKQRSLHPKKETPREKKARQKAAAKQRKKENAPGNKDAELEKGTTVITTGIKELYV